jgi:ADP-ribose pyrophosphatase YjhB (NUDIX family)
MEEGALSESDVSGRWMRWARELRAIAQNGLEYSTNEFDLERYRRLRETAAEMLEPHVVEDLPAVKKVLSLEDGPGTPRIAVRGFVIREGQLLLVRDNFHGGLWTVPGGWADVNETPAQAVAREVLEETGYRVKPLKVTYVHDQDVHGHLTRPYHTYSLHFLAEIVGGEPTTNVEVSEIKFFDRESLPPLSLDCVTEREIDVAFAHHRDPARATDFD